jgi:hypothetical protein
MKNRSALAPSRNSAFWLLCASLIGGSCGAGRTPLLDPTCSIVVNPKALDFGTLSPPDQESQAVVVTNRSGALCQLSGIVLSPATDDSFALGPNVPTSLMVQPGERASIEVVFSPATARVPLARAGALLFSTNDPKQGLVQVELQARIRTECALTVAPSAVDFGHVRLDDAATSSVVVTNTGSGACDIGAVAIVEGSAPQFSLPAGTETAFALAPGEQHTIPLSFHADDHALPHHRTGQLGFEDTDAKQPTVRVPLAGDIDVGCELILSPDTLSFGNVILNTTASASVTLSNDGSDPCNVTGVALGQDSDPGFSLNGGQALAFVVAPGTTHSVGLQFSASDSTPPHLKTGTLVLATGNPHQPQASVPLSATVSTVCVEASRWVYTVDETGIFSRFDPATLTFTDISQLACPTTSTPFSMAVDQNAVAWVAYRNGDLFKVDTATGKCEATSFKTGQSGLLNFGMGFVFDPSTDVDTLYIAGGPDYNYTSSNSSSTLAVVSFPELIVKPIGTVTAGWPELSGTGDGSLWGFIPASASAKGQAVLVQLDPTSGATLKSYAYPTLTSSGAWAMKFWGGSFWIFLSTSVYEVSRSSPDVIHTVIAQSGHSIVGAGVSTCAPLH